MVVLKSVLSEIIKAKMAETYQIVVSGKGGQYGMARRPYVSRVYQMGGRRHANKDLGATLQFGQLLVCGTLDRHSIQHGLTLSVTD